MDTEKLKELLSEIKKMQVRASQDIPANNGTTVGGHISRKRVAKLRIPELEREYALYLRNHIVPIIVAGSTASEFVSMATSLNNIVSVDGEGLYKEIIKKLPKEAGNGKMGPKAIVDTISRLFTDVASEASVVSYPSIFYKGSRSFAVKNTQDLERLVKRTLNDTVGPQMALVFNLKEIANQAIKNEFSSQFLPVLVAVSDENLVSDILKGSEELLGMSFLLISGETQSNMEEKALASSKEVDEKSISTALNKVKQAIKKMKGKTK
jgi:hypothetical protein